ncbi:hypothetical protein MKW94_007540 [Papaver nudicaule]|uniref:non-specific serine/threonine protein kinase n=1 Tax=Papaver nudicaule TaxID=74823 RepID=A0AA41VF68_PAPNU|nr:hypothetical protein [Papaver nudicaule]
MSTNTTAPPLPAPVPTTSPPAPPPAATASPPSPTATTVPPPATSPPSTVPPPTGSPPADTTSPPAPPTGGDGGSPPTTPGSGTTVTPPAPSGGRGTGGRSPSNPTTPNSSSSNPPSSEGSKVNTGLISGIVIGGVVVLVVVGLLFLFFRKKKRRDNRPSNYYIPPPPGPKGGQPQQWQHNASPPPADHYVSVPPKPTPPPPRPPHSPSRFGPPSMPPQPFMSSSGGSGSNYSGTTNPYPPPSPGMSLGFSKSTFTYEELKMATNGFSDANLLGQGGFGYVHKGVLPNGAEVAVKSLKAGSGQGEREFQAEVEIISRVHHRHLVSLVGYCMVGDKRMLVYEFVPNNTLEFHLHGKGRPTMDWSTRLKIALGSAKGLAYLHEDCHPKIIHRDIKAANILIDFKFEAQVADFGLAKIASDTNTHVSTRVMGTFGYLAPEYASSGKLSDKSDVFSFGVMLLELITGRRPVDSNQSYMDDSLVDWARPLLSRAMEDGVFDALVDPKLQKDYNPNEMKQMIACAASCVRHSARRRPRMSQVVRALEGNISLQDLNEGIRPGQSSAFSSYGSSDYDTVQYKEDMLKFRQMALASQEHGSTPTGYSGVTSEYGLNPSVSSSEGQQTQEMEMGRLNKDS